MDWKRTLSNSAAAIAESNRIQPPVAGCSGDFPLFAKFKVKGRLPGDGGLQLHLSDARRDVIAVTSGGEGTRQRR